MLYVSIQKKFEKPLYDPGFSLSTEAKNTAARPGARSLTRLGEFESIHSGFV